MKKKLVTVTKITKVIRVSEILKDMLEDISDEELLEKYQIGWVQLGKLYGKLLYGGFIDKNNMRHRLDLRAGRSSSHIPFVEINGSASTYVCVACGYKSTLHFSTCPKCHQVNLRRLRRSVLSATSRRVHPGNGAGAPGASIHHAVT
jgi:ribosomal protein L40E